MRIKTIIATFMAAAVLTPAAQAQPILEGELDAAASFVAQQPTTVHCEGSSSAWRTMAARVGFKLRKNDRLDGYVMSDEDVVYLAPRICRAFQQLQDGAYVPDSGLFGGAFLALAHEATHVYGYWDEADTQCRALTQVKTIARKFFGATRAQAITIYEEAVMWKNASPAPYDTPCAGAKAIKADTP